VEIQLAMVSTEHPQHSTFNFEMGADRDALRGCSLTRLSRNINIPAGIQAPQKQEVLGRTYAAPTELGIII
jgi:hypothetical protein